MASGSDIAVRSDASEIDASQLAACIAAMADGSEEAFGEFYDATLGKVYGVAVRIIGDSARAEDVVADVYFDAWTKAPSYSEERGNPLAWLLTICKSRALDAYRREASAERKVQAAEDRGVRDVVAEPVDLLEAIEGRHAIHAVLAEISAEDRQLVALAFFKGLSHQQIADMTAMPLGTVKSRIRRALRSLADSLGAELEP